MARGGRGCRAWWEAGAPARRARRRSSCWATGSACPGSSAWCCCLPRPPNSTPASPAAAREANGDPSAPLPDAGAGAGRPAGRRAGTWSHPQRPLRYWRLIELDEPRAERADRDPHPDRRADRQLHQGAERDGRAACRDSCAGDGRSFRWRCPTSHERAVRARSSRGPDRGENGDAPAGQSNSSASTPPFGAGLARRRRARLQRELYEVTPERVPEPAAELGDSCACGSAKHCCCR